MRILATALVGLAATLAAVPPASAGAAPGAVVRVRPTPPSPSLIVPVEFRGGMPTLEVMVNGRGPLRIGLDTGAMSGLYLFNGHAGQVGLKPVGELTATDPTGANPQHLDTFGDADVAIGGRIFKGEVFGGPAPGAGGMLGLDGVAGLEVFGPGLVTIDFAKRQVTVEDSAILPAADGRTVFAYEGPLPRLPLQVEGHRVDAYLDTGNVRAGILVPSALADQLSGRSGATSAGVAHSISNEVQLYRMALSGRAQIGDTPLASTEAQFPSVGPIGIVGAAALQGLVVRIDTANRRAQVLTPTSTPRALSALTARP